MWADAVVSGLAPITIHAEYLKTGREIVGNEPTVNLLSAASLQTVVYIAAMLSAVIVHMVNGEKRWFCFTATGALVSAVCVVTFILKPLVIAPSAFAVPIKVG
jgi:archaellum biogenesis protein FlaJ (TadC family)